jgi:multidrug efflux system membrane fusion protein
LSRWLTIVFGVLAIGGVFFLFRSMMAPGGQVQTVQAQTIPTLDKPVPGQSRGRDGMQVQVRRSEARMRPTYISVNGRTGPSQTVTVKAMISGGVTATPAEPGRMVRRDAVLCELDAAGRDARLREAQANMASKELDWRRAADLAARGWAAEARVTSARAAFDAAKASYDVARLEMDRTRVKAPVAGIFERRLANVGDYLGPGAPCGTIVVLDPILVTAEVDDAGVGQITEGAAAAWTQQDGAIANGRVRTLSRTANPDTRGYKVEIEIENPAGRIPVGGAAELRVQVGQTEKHHAARAMVTTDGSGRIGVRYVDVGGVVQFAPADVNDQDAEGWWIAGLPHETLLLTEGQPDAQPGLRVNPVASDPPASPTPPS